MFIWADFAHTRLSAGFPGYDGRIPADKGTIAEILRENGYNTFAVGKWGVTPDEDATDAGPFDRWPLGKGFDHFLGFLGSQTDQYKPDLVEDNAHVTPDGRHLSEQITDKAISYIESKKKRHPINHSSCIMRRVQHMHRTRLQKNGAINTKANSMKDGMCIAKKFLPIRKNWASFPQMHNCLRAIQM